MIFFVENLTLRVWFFHVLPWLAQARRAGKAARVCRVVEASRPSWVIARIIGPWLGVEVEKFTFRLADVRDDNDLLVRLRIPYQDIPSIRNRIAADARFQEFLRKINASERLPFFIAKQVTDTQIVFEGTMGRLVFLIQACRWAAQTSGSSTTTVFVEQRAWQSVLNTYAAEWGIDLRAVPGRDHAGFSRRVLGLFPAPLVSLLNTVRFRRRDFKSLDYALGLARALFLPRRKADAPIRPQIAVNYTGQLHLDAPHRYSDLFFLHNSPIKPSDVVVCFGVPGAPLTAAKRDELAKHGIRSVAQRPEMTTVFDVPVYNFGSSAPPVSKSENFEQDSLEQSAADYKVLRDGWKDFFENENIKLYVSWLKQNPVHGAIGDGIKAAGGVQAIYQRSFEPLPTHELLMDCDIAFNFSNASADVERAGGSKIRYHVATGYLGDFRFPLLKPYAQEIRAKMLATGVKHIVAFFDENSSADPRWHTGHALQREGYALILEKVINDPGIGLLLKPKVPSTLRARLGPVAETLRVAEKTGRCLLLGDGETSSALPPVAAALAADLAIHNCLAAATAGIEAALAGVPTLLMDREGWGVSPITKLGGNVVFTDWAKLWSAVEKDWRQPSNGFGRWGNYLDELDPFRDGRAAERMATYMDWIMEAFRAGKDREAAMAIAAEKYAAAWGADKVVEICDGKILPLKRREHVALA